MEKENKRLVLKRHSFYRALLFPVVKLIAAIYGFKNKSHFKIKKGESYLVLCNHQTGLDPIYVMMAFNRHLYAVATDTLMSNGFTSKLLSHCFGVIPKKKGIADYDANKKMLQVINEGGSLLLFPEGNRQYAEFQFSFTKSFAKFIKNLKRTVILYNLHGGTGVQPRFTKKKRKGQFYGKIRRVLRYDDYKDMSDEELYELVSEELKIYDSNSPQKYKSKASAEYLERIFFVCPKCGKVETLYSEGDFIECKECGFKVQYTNNLHLVTNDENIKFTKMLDWYNYQIRYLKDMQIGDGVIFSDEEVGLYTSYLYEKRKLITKGKIELYKDRLVIGEKTIKVSDIVISSPVGGTKFTLKTDDEDMLIIGNDRFNPLKYVFMFNKLDTKMKLNNLDIHYTLDERTE
ncbi:MAG: 1-acyl-sn-glycerol-3-phosphate acyltransferase [Bacilli bacterium]|nr:1-acyl-sn-glycerol-3-phosphate acyltransferase [Bacilli bacterium]